VQTGANRFRVFLRKLLFQKKKERRKEKKEKTFFVFLKLFLCHFRSFHLERKSLVTRKCKFRFECLFSEAAKMENSFLLTNIKAMRATVADQTTVYTPLICVAAEVHLILDLEPMLCFVNFFSPKIGGKKLQF
jgi:hypothetical protein